jgi:RimJ/RimL family protein N-acetyltransferase
MTTSTSPPPPRAQLGPTVLAALSADHGAEVADAVNESLEHLAPWMDWAHRPTTAHEQAMRLALAEERRKAGGDATWMILDGDDADRVIGGCGLHHRAGTGTMDIGYWLRADATGRGHATRAAAALARVGFELLALDEINIICKATNASSASVARRLGFTHVETRDESMTWKMAASAWPSSPAAAMSVDAAFGQEEG